MKKILLIILLTIVSSIEYIAKAQGFKAEERQKIVNYVNCYYTARYILNNPDYKQENKAIEKYKINVDSVEDAYEYDTLYGYLKESGVLDYTADRLTKKLNAIGNPSCEDGRTKQHALASKECNFRPFIKPVNTTPHSLDLFFKLCE